MTLISSRIVSDHPGFALSAIVAVSLLVAGGLHLYVTGEPLGVSLSNPIDSLAISLLVLVLSIVNLAAWAFAPAAYTAFSVRLRRAEIARLGLSNTWIASCAALIVSLLCFSSLATNWRIDASLALVLFCVSLLAAIALIACPRIEFGGQCSSRRAWMMVALWLISVIPIALISTAFFLRLSESTGWLADPTINPGTKHVLISALSGVAVFSAALIPEREDRRQVFAVSIGLIGILCIVGAVRPSYSEALRVTGFGQERVEKVWLTEAACGPARSIADLRIQSQDDGSCVLEGAYVVVRGPVDVVLSASASTARNGARLRIPRAALLAELEVVSHAGRQKSE